MKSIRLTIVLIVIVLSACTEKKNQDTNSEIVPQKTETAIDVLKKEMAAELNMEDLSELDYITEELLIDYLFSPSQFEDKENLTDLEADENAKALNSCRWGVYGNSLVTKNGYIHYKRGKKGTTRYGCGNDNWTWRLDRGDYYKKVRTCPNGKAEYLICCPSCS